MEKFKLYIPEGMRDILFEECSCKNEIISILRNNFTKSGFKEISSPTLEFYDVFSGENMFIEQEKTYKLFDSRGRILVLKPDATVPVARIASTKLREAAYPLRLCYNSNVFRMNDSLEGKINESTQCGVEVIGINSYKSDSELIILAIKSLLAVGIEDFEIELGQANFFKAIVEDTNLSEIEKEKLRTLVERKNFNGMRDFSETYKDKMGNNCEIVAKLPELFGSVEVIDKARRLTSNIDALNALQNIKDIHNTLTSVGLEAYVSIDLGMVQYIDYYTGITFKGYCKESGKEVLSGGRYDNLIKTFGMQASATGFAIDIDNVLFSLKMQNKIKNKNIINKLIHYEGYLINEAYSFAEQLKKRGYVAELSLLDDKEASLIYAAKKGLYELIVMIDSETIEVVTVQNGEKKSNKISDYIKILGVKNE